MTAGSRATTSHLRSEELYRRARALVPGGVNSPVRALRAVGLDAPPFFRRGEGAYVEDEDGNRYVDWMLSWGPLVFGHADPEIVAAVQAAAADGTSFGAPTEREVALAEEIVDAVPSVEMVRLVSSGTEAAMAAIRLARGATRRDRIIKFTGCYHGHADALLASAGSGLATLGIPSTPGVPTGAIADTVVAPFNDVDAAAAAVERYGEGLAAIIVEPVAGNMGVVPPEPGFLEALRTLTEACGALLVFDEVMTGFRVARGGAQERYGVTPDLTVLGKIVGGGMPLAAFGGRADVMSRLAPSGEVYQAGTLSGNPLATAAALVALRRLRDPAVYEELERKGQRLEDGLRAAAAGQPVTVQRVGAMATVFFHPGPVRNFDDASACDTERFGAFFRHMLERGVYLPPSQYEAMFLATAHGDGEIDRTVAAAAEFFES
jgi:glutamate-1-semialdehyde 2,1-aminomutase